MTRLVTAFGLILFAVYLLFLAPDAIFLGGAILVASLCYFEYAHIVAAHAIPKPGVVGWLLGIGLLFRPYYGLLLAILATLAELIWCLRQKNPREIAPAAATTIFGAFYAMAPWRFAVDLRNVSIHLLFFALAVNWVGDSMAFYIGRKFGRHKLAPAISPGKSWEGAIASIVGAVVFGLIYLHYFVPQLSYLAIVAMAVAGNVLGQLGDLVESSLKRGAGLKDSGSLLPGHGGVLDRLDGSLFTVPAIYFLSRTFNLF